MEIIKSIQVRKFRSLKSITQDLDLTDLNIFVGRNDQGKSNILRALNLFFNNETDIDCRFRFDDDYCYHSNTGKGTNKEIRIDLVIHPPEGRFKYAKPLKWTKCWKSDGSITEERKYIASGEALPAKDNVSKWLDKIRYRYVPAIKGQSYFSALMGELHDVLNEAHSTLLGAQGEEFISGIQDVTTAITEELNKQIGISSTIQVPSDFKQLFSSLDFGTRIGKNTYHLKQRGDGVKVRHIPVILKYMSEAERNVSRAGYVKPDTIWGFEEPENNLELRYAFELAETFKAYSSDIQIFVTTHSPAFYALDESEGDGVKTFYISQGGDGCTKVVKVTHGQSDSLHETMGLLPIITPYLTRIYEGQKEIARLESELSSISDSVKCVVLTEDKDFEHVEEFFRFNGFLDDETEYFSYSGAGQITGAVVLAKYLSAKNPDLKVVIHRDRDYLSEGEVAKIRCDIEKHGHALFITDGVDVESHYLSVEHFLELYPELTKLKVVGFIEDATNEAREDSISRLVDHCMKNEKPQNGAYYSKIKELEALYEGDKQRYRYGKKVCSLVKSKIQKEIKRNPVIFRATDYVKDSCLVRIAHEIWGCV